MDFTELKLLQKQHSTLMKKYKVEAEAHIKSSMASLFTRYPKLDEISLSVSNHEFNDGDPTSFYINYDEPGINGTDDEDDEDLGGLTKKEFVTISEKVRLLFKAIDPVLETLYGDESECIYFCRDSEAE